MPAAISPGIRISGSDRAAEPARFDHQDGGDDGRAEDHRDRGEASGRGQTISSCGGASFFASFTANIAEPRADRDERRLRPEHEAEAEGRERGERDARHHVGLVAAHLEPVRGNVPALPGEPHDRRTRPGARPAPSTGSGPPVRHRRRSRARRAGRVNTPIWIWCTSSRKPHDANETKTPMIAANTRSTTKLRLRRIAAGSSGGGAGAAGAGCQPSITCPPSPERGPEPIRRTHRRARTSSRT